jgi:dynein heavy chain
VLCGRIKGEMPLPLPHGTESMDADAVANGNGHASAAALSAAAPAPEVATLLHSIESAVIEWTRQIRAVLKRDSAQLLMEGQNPGALVEIEFWGARKKNVDSLQAQLQSPRVAKMQEILDEHKSSYGDSLRQLIAQVDTAVRETKDIVLHLEPLRVYVEALEDAELSAVPAVMQSILTTLRLIWQHSKYYNTPRHLVIVLREVCNQIIHTIVGSIEPRSLFAQELEEAVQKPRAALQVIAWVHAAFEATRATVAADSKAGKCSPWEFESQLVFARLDAYAARIQKLADTFAFFLDYAKLEKVEVSGEKVTARPATLALACSPALTAAPRPQQLNNQIKQLFAEQAERFDQLIKETGDEGYDCLNPDVPNFDRTHDELRALAADFDRRLASVACQAIERVQSLEAAFKLMVGFQGLLDRPDIADDVRLRLPLRLPCCPPCTREMGLPRVCWSSPTHPITIALTPFPTLLPLQMVLQYPRLLDMYEQELAQVKALFDQQKRRPLLNKNMPHTAGALKVRTFLRRAAAV